MRERLADLGVDVREFPRPAVLEENAGPVIGAAPGRRSRAPKTTRRRGGGPRRRGSGRGGCGAPRTRAVGGAEGPLIISSGLVTEGRRARASRPLLPNVVEGGQAPEYMSGTRALSTSPAYSAVCRSCLIESCVFEACACSSFAGVRCGGDQLLLRVGHRVEAALERRDRCC